MLAAATAPVRQRLAAWNLVGVRAATMEVDGRSVFLDYRLKPFARNNLVWKHLHESDQGNTILIRLAGYFPVRIHLFFFLNFRFR